MSRLIILLGFDGLGPAATPRCVYVGRDAAEAEAARAACPDACTLMVRNPAGVRKVNQAVAEKMNHDLIASREGTNLVAAAPLAQSPVEEGSVPLLDGQAADTAELPQYTAAAGEGDLPGGPANEIPHTEGADDPEKVSDGPPPQGQASPGSMSPKGKKGR